MKNSNLKTAFATITLGVMAVSSMALQVGCSSHLGADATDTPLSPTTAKPAKFENAVAGPALSGTWISSCVEDARESNTWDIITFTISGQNVTRHSDQYADSACVSFKRALIETGLYRYQQAITTDEYAVEYQFKFANGTYKQEENLRADVDGSIWLSNEIGGDADAYVHLLVK